MGSILEGVGGGLLRARVVERPRARPRRPPLPRRVFIEGCDEANDEFVFWSWGRRYPAVSGAWLRAAACAFVVAPAAATTELEAGAGPAST